jgi:hypothetical protein
VQFAYGAWVVQDDPIWLPATNGCSDLAAVLESAAETVLILSVLSFAPPSLAGYGINGTSYLSAAGIQARAATRRMRQHVQRRVSGPQPAGVQACAAKHGMRQHAYLLQRPAACPGARHALQSAQQLLL